MTDDEIDTIWWMAGRMTPGEFRKYMRVVFASIADTPRYSEWKHLRTYGQWSDGIPEWARDYSGKMNDMTAAVAVIEELAAAVSSGASIADTAGAKLNQVSEFRDEMFAISADMNNSSGTRTTCNIVAVRLSSILDAPPASSVADAAVHPDDLAVDEFAQAMKEKLAQAREKGRGGWQECSIGDLSRMLREHVEKGDPRDVANFCMFLWHLKAPILQIEDEPVAGAKPVAQWQTKLREPILPECDTWINVSEEGARMTMEKWPHIYEVRALVVAATPAPRRSLEVMQAVSDLNSRHAAVRAPAPSVADAAGASEGLADFEWPKLPKLPRSPYAAGYASLFTEHQMQGYANAYGEAVRIKLSAEIAALRERIAELEREQLAWRKFTDEANATMDKADERIAGMEKDAARYRWLRNEHFPTADNPPLAQVVWKTGDRHWNQWSNLIDGNDLDRAIDDAIAKESGK